MYTGLKALVLMTLLTAASGCQKTSSNNSLFTFQHVTAPVHTGYPALPGYTQQPKFIEKDFNLDGIPELIVEDPRTRSNSGSDYIVYRKIDDKYKHIGVVFMNPDVIRVLEPTDEYPMRILRYGRSNANEFTADTVGLQIDEFQNGVFSMIEQEVVSANEIGADKATQRYKELFGS